MTEQTHNRLRTLTDPDRLPALSPEYLRAQPALGLGLLREPVDRCRVEHLAPDVAVTVERAHGTS